MMRTLILFWYDIKGYFMVRSILRKQMKSVDFNKLGLRVDWVNRAYTVINPSEEDKGDDPSVLRIKAQNKMLPIHRYMDKIGLSEFVSVSVEQIPDSEDPTKLSDSYLLVYYPIFRVITTWKVVVFFVISGVASWALYYFL
jgi:hypothetical protein